MAAFSAVNAALALFSSIALFATHLGRADDAHWSVFVAAACCMVIAAHQTVSFVFNMQIQRRLKKARANNAEPRAVTSGDEPRALGAADARPFADVRSVTEGTTELLEPQPRTGAGREGLR